MNEQAQSADSGVTLIECVIASMVLVISLSALISSFSMARRSTVMADRSMDGMQLGRQEMEHLFALNYNDQRLALGTHTISNGSYVVTMNDSYDDTKDIELSVYWHDAITYKTSSVTLVSSMTECLHQ